MASFVDAGSGGMGSGRDLGERSGLAAQRGWETCEMREGRGEDAIEKGGREGEVRTEKNDNQYVSEKALAASLAQRH